MPSPMIERAARALYQSAPDDYDVHQMGEDATWPDLVPQVRAVLLAIREPDDAMALAGGALTYPGPYSTGCEEAIGVWQAMIDAALGGG